MKHYARILRYLKPHAPVFATAVFATFIFAGLDAFSIALLIPFLRTVFRRVPDASDGSGSPTGDIGVGGEGAAAGQDEGFLEGLLDGTLGRIVDLDADPQAAIRGIILFILVVFAVKNVFDFIRAYLVARVEQGVTRDLRNQVYDHLLELDLAFFGRTKMGQIVSRLTHDVEQLRTLLTKELGKVISSVFEFAAAVVFMVAISLKLTLAAFVVIPATMVMWGPLVRKLRKGDRRVLNLAGEVNAHIQETLAGIRLVKSSAAEPHESHRFHGLTQRYFKTFVRTERLRALAAPITEMLAAIGTVILLWYGAHLVLVGGELSGEEFVVFLGLSMKLYAPVKYLSKFPALVQPGLVGAERVFEFLDAPIEIRDRPGALPFPGLEREITYEEVHFAYREGEPVLEGISLTVPKGSVIALVGPSGG
ncbi:MAG: ABC transporter ATP-binding protein, partial [Gemmatimonadetes bacterium]|nr:ABC transporter ATP-binding protein [Gemmatimonadota bacterium]